MAVLRMVIDVRRDGDSPANPPAGGAPLDVRMLRPTGRSPALAAAVAASCGLRPAGFVRELASRPGRRVLGWGAVQRDAEAVAGTDVPPDPEAALVGVILLTESSPSGAGPAWLSIPWLLVRPDCRRLGVGRALVAAALVGARGLGADRVTIDTLDRWPEAVAFWRSMGFKPVGPSS